jgi:hypothetical protein
VEEQQKGLDAVQLLDHETKGAASLAPTLTAATGKSIWKMVLLRLAHRVLLPLPKWTKAKDEALKTHLKPICLPKGLSNQSKQQRFLIRPVHCYEARVN